MSSTAVYSRTHSVTYVADNILRSLKNIIRQSGLDPSSFVQDWDVHMRGLKAWLESEHLEKVLLEIYHPTTNVLIKRWDIDVIYNWSGGDGAFWVDTDQIAYAMRKAGIAPSSAKYDLVIITKAGRPDVQGWITGQTRSTAGMVRQALGSTVEHSGLGASTSYWRQA